MGPIVNGILVLLLFAWFVTPGKYLGIGGMGAGMFVGFLLCMNGPDPWSSWWPWVLLPGSLVCFGVWLFRKFEPPSSSRNHESQGKNPNG